MNVESFADDFKEFKQELRDYDRSLYQYLEESEKLIDVFFKVQNINGLRDIEEQITFISNGIDSISDDIPKIKREIERLADITNRR